MMRRCKVVRVRKGRGKRNGVDEIEASYVAKKNWGGSNDMNG